ncbi:MAG: aminotransferase class I/II-fold pyridoxal phosphate-dependent enzyme, partial [Verrucomicrobiae bacterium]|nr:aminotransferase class I/II-fold pyridoxal phosphate-dependent enzyme [Verrucomicrobiae bacterium]
MCKLKPSKRAEPRIPLSVPHMGGSELARVREVFESGWVTTAGQKLVELEKRFTAMTGCPAVALANGTSALHLAVKLAGVSEEDEVVMPTLTFAATANAVLYERGRPVFLDVTREDWGLDAELLVEFLEKRARTNRLPKAVIVVHLFGQCADLDPILEACKRHGVT